MLIKTEVERLLMDGLTKGQQTAVRSGKRRVLVVAGAGSGKTEVMARRIAWWVGVDGVPRDSIVAFTFTERAAEEMKFRIRSWIARITPEGEDVALGNMYIGTIHAFCLAKIREYWPDEYHNYDILDEASRAAFILRGFTYLLGLQGLRAAWTAQIGRDVGQHETINLFIHAYDQLHEHNRFLVRLPAGAVPQNHGPEESEWCKQAELVTAVGDTPAALAFAKSAARYYADLRCRRFLDFATSQTEFIRRLSADTAVQARLVDVGVHLVVDEVQDVNPVQHELMVLLTGHTGKLTTVGDHRQAIYGFRGAKVEIIARLWEEFKSASDAEVVDLKENFRSTPRIIDLANRWARSITPLRGMTTPDMAHGNKKRKDHHKTHVAAVTFTDRASEATWIADAVRALVPSDADGAEHDKRDGTTRGLALSDIAVLVRTSTDVRTYMQALEGAGIPCVVKAGPDLFSQPEVLLILAALALSAGHTTFYGSANNPKSLPSRIQRVLGCPPEVEKVLKEAAKLLRSTGLPFARTDEERLAAAARVVGRRIKDGASLSPAAASGFRTPGLREFVTSRRDLRRVFPQQLYHSLLSEAGVDAWDASAGRGSTAMFHLGALSGLITGIETPGWTSTGDYPYQISGLFLYGAEQGRAEEQPLMVQPDAVTISTIHGVKGLEFPAVFLADVVSRRFPNGRARTAPNLPLSGKIVREIDMPGLADDANYNGERRLMYVALTRAERFLFVTTSSDSSFLRELRPHLAAAGAVTTNNSDEILQGLKYLPKELRRDVQLSTSFSDLRYYLECPHDFYLRKVLGFAPTIDQAFGYGRGVHNLLRAVHSDPKRWAALAADKTKLEAAVQQLIDRGLFYLRYTTGEPADNMRRKGLSVVADYIRRYVGELQSLTFEPEKQFETLVSYEDGEGGALVSGAIDIVRCDDPPRVTLIDFKSGEPESDKHKALDAQEMQLQVAIYAVAAKKELEYQPERGLVRYLDAAPGDQAELAVPLDPATVDKARTLVAQTAAKIRDRRFSDGPSQSRQGNDRCGNCDFLGICGLAPARAYKKAATRG